MTKSTDKIPVPPAAEIQLLRNQGRDRTYIAEHYGVSLATVKRWVLLPEVRALDLRPQRDYALYHKLIVEQQLRPTEIRKLVGKCLSTVLSDVHSFGLKRDICKLTTQQRDRRERFVRLRRSGMTYTQIGEAFGFSQERARQLSVIYGLNTGASR